MISPADRVASASPALRLRLYQLASQALPIGGYSHSHGLEAAIEAGLVGDEATLTTWLADLLQFSIGTYEAPLLLRLYAAWEVPDAARIATLNAQFLATRETAELRAATVQMGYSLRRLTPQLPDIPPATLATLTAVSEPALPCAWAAITAAWATGAGESLLAYLWSWAENQVLVAVKTVPLGQSAGQRVLAALTPLLAARAQAVLAADQATVSPYPGASPVLLSNFSPALAILSSRHETQYSRLFRS
jgi:urease accessory protein